MKSPRKAPKARKKEVPQGLDDKIFATVVEVLGKEFDANEALKALSTVVAGIIATTVEVYGVCGGCSLRRFIEAVSHQAEIPVSFVEQDNKGHTEH